MTQESSSLSPKAEGASRRLFWVQILLFLAVLIVVMFPYIKRYIPQVEKAVDPSSFYQRKGDMALQGKKYSEAISHYKKALLDKGLLGGIRGRQRSMVFYKIALAHIYLKQYKEAIPEALEARKVSPNWFPPYTMLGDLFSRLRDADNFNELESQLKQRFISRWETWILLGNGYLRFGKSDKALPAYEKAITKLAKEVKNPSLRSRRRRLLKLTYARLERQLKSLKNRQKLLAALKKQALAKRNAPPKRQKIVPPKRQAPPTTRPAPKTRLAPPTTRPAYRYVPTSLPASIPFRRTKVPLPRYNTHKRSKLLLPTP